MLRLQLSTVSKSLTISRTSLGVQRGLKGALAASAISNTLCQSRFCYFGALLTFDIYQGTDEVELDEKLLRELSFQARGDLAPMAAFFGGCKLREL